MRVLGFLSQHFSCCEKSCPFLSGAWELISDAPLVAACSRARVRSCPTQRMAEQKTLQTLATDVVVDGIAEKIVAANGTDGRLGRSTQAADVARQVSDDTGLPFEAAQVEAAIFRATPPGHKMIVGMIEEDTGLAVRGFKEEVLRDGTRCYSYASELPRSARQPPQSPRYSPSPWGNGLAKGFLT